MVPCCPDTRRGRAMDTEVQMEIVRLLQKQAPQWVFVLVMGVILGLRAPQLIRELFAGIQGVIRAIRQPPRGGSLHGRGIPMAQSKPNLRSSLDEHEIDLKTNPRKKKDAEAARPSARRRAATEKSGCREVRPAAQ